MNTNSIRKLMAKGLPYCIRRVIPLRIAQHLYFNGVFQGRLNGKKVVKLLHTGHQIENEIYWRGFEGCHEKKSMEIFASIVRHLRPSVVWDIGANSGTYGLLAKALNSDSEVVFFEPIPKAVEMIKANLRLNGFQEKVFEIAIGDFEGEGEIFFERGYDFATSVTVNRNTVPDGLVSEALKIGVRRLDSLIEEQSLNTPELIKLDVETFEYEVLKGWGTKFPINAIFLIEILHEDLAFKLEVFFPVDRYEFWNIDDRKKSMSKMSKLGKSEFYNVLIVPTSKSEAFKNLPEVA